MLESKPPSNNENNQINVPPRAYASNNFSAAPPRPDTTQVRHIHPFIHYFPLQTDIPQIYLNLFSFFFVHFHFVSLVIQLALDTNLKHTEKARGAHGAAAHLCLLSMRNARDSFLKKFFPPKVSHQKKFDRTECDEILTTDAE